MSETDNAAEMMRRECMEIAERLESPSPSATNVCPSHKDVVDGIAKLLKCEAWRIEREQTARTTRKIALEAEVIRGILTVIIAVTATIIGLKFI